MKTLIPYRGSIIKTDGFLSQVGSGSTANQVQRAGKEVDIGLGGGCDKLLRPANLLLYSWDEGLDVCVNLTWSSPLTQTGMVDFVPDRAVIDATHRKRVKYEARHRIWFSHLFIFLA
ncbi:hypothetical protein Tco_0958606 [Tanacetum coccineum]